MFATIECQILATDRISQVMIATIAVCLTLISPCALKIIQSFSVWFFRPLTNTANSSPSSESRGERAPLLQNGANVQGTHRTLAGQERPQTSAAHPADTVPETGDFLGIFRQSKDGREIFWNVVKYLCHYGKKQSEKPSIPVMLISIVVFGMLVAQAVAGVFSAKIASDRAGLSSSRHCGIWQFDHKAGEEDAYLDDLNNHQKEARASRYARSCYNSPDPASPFPCGHFYNQSIEFKTLVQQPCPFESPELCLDGLYSAVTFDTGLVDASTIGINAPRTHKFRRTTSCSPLNRSEPYVTKTEGVNNILYRYNYGPKGDTDYTFSTTGNPFEWLVPVYSVK